MTASNNPLIELPSNVVTDTDPDGILNYTQQLRRTIVKELVQHGIPVTDETRMKMLNDTLNGLDRAAIGTKRIAADEKANDKNLAAAAALAQAILKNPITATLHKVESGNVIEGECRGPVLDDNLIPPPKLVPGETDIGHHRENFAEFQRRMQDREPPSN